MKICLADGPATVGLLRMFARAVWKSISSKMHLISSCFALLIAVCAIPLSVVSGCIVVCLMLLSWQNCMKYVSNMLSSFAPILCGQPTRSNHLVSWLVILFCYDVS